MVKGSEARLVANVRVPVIRVKRDHYARRVMSNEEMALAGTAALVLTLRALTRPRKLRGTDPAVHGRERQPQEQRG